MCYFLIFWWETIVFYIDFPPQNKVISLTAFKDFSLVFRGIMIVCIAMDFLGFILLWICSLCLICRFLSFAKLKKKSAAGFWKRFSPNSFSSPSGVQMTQFLKNSSTSPLNSIYFFQPIIFLLFKLGDFCCFIYEFSDSSVFFIQL